MNGTPVYPGRPCPHSTGAGCNDYANRPVDPCVHFICGWRMDGSPLPDWMKPNTAKVIVLFDQTRWRGMPVDVAVPVGRTHTATLAELADGIRTGIRPARGLLYSEQVVDQKGQYTNQQGFSGVRPARIPAGDGRTSSRRAAFLSLPPGVRKPR